MVTQTSHRQNYKTERASQPSHYWRSLTLLCLTLFLAAILIFGGVRAWAWMQKPTSFPIKQIDVQGQLTHVSSVTLQKIVQTKLIGGFFSLHLSAAKQAILALPWIADVSFRRVWPDTVNVKVTEQQPVARFGKTGVLSAAGNVFYPDIKTIPDRLPDLEGPVDQVQQLLNFFQMTNTVAQVLGLKVITLHVNTVQSWDLMLSNQVHVILGRQKALERFKRFVAIYPKITASSDQSMVSADLRYPNGVAIQYQKIDSATQSDRLY